MEQRELIHQAMQLVNDASTYHGLSDLDSANAKLVELHKLLTDELAVGAPTDEKKPEAAPPT